MNDIENTKVCCTCKKVKSESLFGKSKGCKDGLSPRCKECANLRDKRSYRRDPHTRKKWTKDNPEKRANYVLKHLYGISTEEYNRILKSQNGVCAICGIPPMFQKLNVDHCHETGKVRGLLCNRCNVGLGYFRDSLTCLARAAIYLQSHGVTE